MTDPASPHVPLWREMLVTLALGAIVAVVLFAIYLGVAILRSAW